ncbi:serine/threonine-protein kinase [Spirillospora sp. NPDC047279]|uniref:WD40 repeat domain-containing serine/threonine protein kinase n=1 Tax=Spirillospora sp. NPDC047279 TaxID=3155478 RepID=UPI003410FCD8
MTGGAGSPRTIGPYRVRRLLGSGGMGVVYLAAEPDSGDLVAVKVIRPEYAADPRLRARLRREAAAARRVPRSCTAPVVRADLDAEPPYIATEYIDGPTLDVRVLESEPLTGDALIELAAGVAVALDAVHGCGVLHRDLKPSNIVLSDAGPRVIDFGIARLDDSETELTGQGGVLGTPSYMAPEQVRGETLTKAADVFAWAGVVVYAATGRPPFGTGEGFRDRILDGEPALPDLPEPLAGLVRRAFSKDPAGRPAAGELVTALTTGNAPATRVLRAAADPPVRQVRSTRDLRPPGGLGPLARTSIAFAVAAVLLVAVTVWIGDAVTLGGIGGGAKPSGTPPAKLPGEPLRGHTAAVLAVAVAEVNGKPVAVSGGRDHMVRVWDLTSRTELRKMKFKSDVNAVAIGRLRGRPIVVAGVEEGDRGPLGLGGLGTALRAWDLNSGREVLPELWGKETRAVAIDRHAVYQAAGTELNRRDLDDGDELPGVAGGERWVNDLVTGRLDGRDVVVSMEMFTSVKLQDDLVRILDARSLDVVRTMKVPSPGWRVEFGRAGGGRSVVVAGREENLVVLDARTGRRRGTIPAHQASKVMNDSVAFAVGEVGGRPVVVTGSPANALTVWDLETLRNIRTVPTLESVSDLALTRVNGVDVAVVSAYDKKSDANLRIVPLSTP